MPGPFDIECSPFIMLCLESIGIDHVTRHFVCSLTSRLANNVYCTEVSEIMREIFHYVTYISGHLINITVLKLILHYFLNTLRMSYHTCPLSLSDFNFLYSCIVNHLRLAVI